MSRQKKPQYFKNKIPILLSVEGFHYKASRALINNKAEETYKEIKAPWHKETSMRDLHKSGNKKKEH